MKRICLQMGHINAQHHTIPGFKGNTGAPGEQELNKRIADRTAFMLRERGFEVKQTDAVAYNDKEVTENDWDLFLAIHGDADSPKGSGGCIGFPEPKTDGATEESQRISKEIESLYFHHAEIENKPNKITKGIRYYYMWQYLSHKTPCVLIELGEVQDPHDKVLLGDTNRIGSALTRGICKSFGVVFGDATQPPIEPEDPKDKLIQALEIEVGQLKKSITSVKSEHEGKIAVFKSDCQARINGFQELVQKL